MVHVWRSEDTVELVLTFYPSNSGLQACVPGAFLPEPPLHWESKGWWGTFPGCSLDSRKPGVSLGIQKKGE